MMASQSNDLNLKSYSKDLRSQKILRNVICIFFCFLCLVPFLLLCINATRTSDAIKTGISFIPSTHFLDNWAGLKAKENGMQITLFKSMLNSLIIAVPYTFCAVYFSAMTAYGIHVYNFKLKKAAWAFIMAIMMIPGQVTIIGFYRFMIQLHLIDNYIPLIIPAVAAPAVVFFMKEYMESTLSIEMIEAARIDGAREFRTFNSIIMPIMKPALATQAIFQFIACWNNLFTPSILISTDTKKTLPMFVQILSTEQFRVDYGVVYVGLFVTILPLFVIYFILSRYIVAGVALGGVKG